MNRYYLCIDLKTFYASVECVERGLDPFQTDLIVADSTRSKGAICLAISPKMKQRGIKNRCRIWEIPKHVHPIVAKPRMKKYIKYSAFIYRIYLKYIAKEDIHVYSIDEAFLDVTSYLSMYKMDPMQLAKTIMNDIFTTTGITAAAGIGTNMYLAKIALDITAKHNSSNLGFLNVEKYQKELWHHTPLTDFWQIGVRTETRLHKLHLKDMYDIAHCDEKILYQEFGVNAKYLIEHAKGIEPCTIKDIQSYKPKSHSFSSSQVLFRDYNYIDARKVLTEMIDHMTLRLVAKGLCTENVKIVIGYSKDSIPPLKVSKKFHKQTSSFSFILREILVEYDYMINTQFLIRRIGVWFHNVGKKRYEQLDLFSTNREEEKDVKIEQAMNFVQNKYGKNAILRGVSYEKGATQRTRNKLIGGHHAE